MTSHRLADYLDQMPDDDAPQARLYLEGMETADFLAHGYFDTHLDVVWATVKTALPGLLAQLPTFRAAAISSRGGPETSG